MSWLATRLRVAALSAAEALHHPRLFDAYLSLIDDSDVAVRLRCVKGLGRSGLPGDRVIPALSDRARLDSDGDVQTPGWNRLTQALIDNQTYVTGRDTTLKDTDGNGRLTPNEVGFYPYGSALYLAYYGFPSSDALHTLDTGVGTTKLDPRTVYISGADFSKTRTNTFYYDLAKALTPDSSRFWDVNVYKPGGAQPSFDKQYVRDYLESIRWNKQPPAPALRELRPPRPPDPPLNERKRGEV